MPLKRTVGGSGTAPKAPHLGLLTGLQGGTWAAVPVGAWLLYSDGESPPTPMLLIKVKPGKMGVDLEFACCDNAGCTRRLKMGGKWNGRHYEQGKDEEVKPE